LYLVVLLELVPRGDVLRGVALIRLEDLDVLVLVGGLMDRDEVVVLEELVLVLEGCRALEAEEDLETCWLLALLSLDLLLLLDFFSAKVGSINSIRAKITVPTAILTFCRYFSVAIIHLLSTCNVVTAIYETSSLFIKGTNFESGNKNFAQKQPLLSFALRLAVFL